jgi:hypothetical protein
VFLAGAEGIVALLNLLRQLGPIRVTESRDGSRVGDRNPLTELTVLLTGEWTVILTDLTR